MDSQAQPLCDVWPKRIGRHDERIAKNRSMSTSEKNIIAGSVGSVLEWYDFAIYGYFTPIIATLFFPSDNKLTSLLATFGVFAVGFVARPVGSLIFGHIGDRTGRKRMLAVSIISMSIPTALIGLLPSYDKIGIVAPIVLTLLRIVQGLSVGGEMPGSVVFLVEHAPRGRRGFAGSWAVCGIWGEVLLGSGVATLISTIFPHSDVSSFAWRIPFLLGVAIAGVGVYIRKAVSESPTFESLRSSGYVSLAPILDALRDHWRLVAVTLLATYGYSVAGITFAIYMATYLSVETSMTLGEGLEIGTIGLVVAAGFSPLMGALSDRWGRKPLLLAGLAGIVILSYPGFLLLLHQNFTVDWTAQVGFALLLAAIGGPYPAAMVEQFPVQFRVTGIALGYNTAFALFGGTAPLIATLLIKETGSKAAPSFYLVFSAAVSLLVLFGLRETYRDQG